MDSFSARDMLVALLAFLSVAVVAGAGAALVFLRWQIGKRWLPLPRLRWGRWTGGDVLLTAIMLTLAQSLVMIVLQRLGFFDWIYGEEPSRMRQMLWVGPLALPLFLLLAFAGLHSLSGTYPVDLGLSVSRWPANVLLGYVGFVAATPIVLVTFSLLVLLSDAKPHAFIELTKESPPKAGQGNDGPAKADEPEAQELKGGLSPFEWVLLFLTAVVAAPITEELLFRGVLQGWLRRASLNGHIVFSSMVTFMSALHSIQFNQTAKDAQTLAELADSVEYFNWSRLVITIALGMLYVAWLCRLQQDKLFQSEEDFPPPGSSTDDTDPSESDADADEMEIAAEPAKPANPAWQAQDLKQQGRKTRLAIFGSAMGFGLIHSSWPDPVPLLLLGLVLGWLTQRTQNLVPAMVLHALFNAVALFTLLFQDIVKTH